MGSKRPQITQSLKSSNPFAPSSELLTERGVWGNARLKRAGFLYRDIEFQDAEAKSATPTAARIPIERLTYSGWWFVQRIWINDRPVWQRISWLRIDREIEIQLPPEIDPDQHLINIEINFGPGLRIRRFRLWLGGQPIYDEVG